MPKWMQRSGIAVVAILMTAAAAHAQWTWTPQTGRWINVKKLPKETAELQLEYARTLMLDGQYKRALRETDKFDSYYSDTDFADDNQFLRGEIRLAMGDNRKAAKEFQKVVTSYPDSDLYDKVIEKQYTIGDQLFEKGQERLKKKFRLFRKRPLKQAAEVYTMVVDNQPFTNAAAEAQYKLGLCQFHRKEYTAAAFDYRRVIEDYADSDWVDDASYALVDCYHTESLPAAYDQTPSALTVAAADDFINRYPSDARVEEVKGVKLEMRNRMAEQRLLTAKFYEKRRLFKAARMSYEVVVEQFGDTTSAEEAKQWLSENPAPDSISALGRPQEGL